MSALAICVICVFVQVALTFWAIVAMGRARLAAVRAREVTLAEIALDSSAYPDRVKQFQRNAHNQLETPPLFYAAIALGAALGAVNWAMAAGSVAYVALRLAHRAVHVGANDVALRFKLFVVSLAALAVVWVALGIGLLL